MAKKLTDTQLVILSHASQRDDGAVLPLVDSVTINGAALTKCLQSLLGRGLVEEIDGAPDWRGRDIDDPKILRLTTLGLAAIGVADGEDCAPPKTSKSTTKPKGTKTAAVVKLLRRKQGASVPALQNATGWLPHSVRAALSGLRKKGIAVERDRNAKGETVYRAGS